VSRPVVSIVVPAFDRAGFVETAITSLLEQDYEHLEVIALDDGSRDETSAVLERIAQRDHGDRFMWSRHDNVGQSTTINRGFERARGDLLGYLSSDDYLMPGAISRLAEVAEEHPEGDVFYPDFFIVDERDRVIAHLQGMQHTLVDALRWAVCLPGVGALMRRSCYERIGGWDPRYRFAPDLEWWLRAGDAKFVPVPEPLGAWRVHGGGLTMSDFSIPNVRARLEERLLILDEVFARSDLPPEVRAIEAPAYSAMLIEMAIVIDLPGLSTGDRRFAIEDRLAPARSEVAERQHKNTRMRDVRARRDAEQRAELAAHENGQLQATIDALQEHLALVRHERDVAIARSYELASRVETLSRPLWLTVARQLVPASLRPRVGAAFHRLRSRRAA
jgi:glycosyltransferase involved in cell wall biosynthesis